MDIGEEFAGGLAAIPPVTRVYLFSVAAIAFLTHFDYVSTLQLYFNHKLVFFRHEVTSRIFALNCGSIIVVLEAGDEFSVFWADKF